MDLENTLLNEVEKEKCYHFYIKSKKIQQTSEYSKKEAGSLTENEVAVTSVEREGKGAI